jgi:hypothetical protein
MSKVIKVVLIIIFLGSVGYLINKYFSPSSKDQLGGPAVKAQLCSIDTHVCLPVPENADSGTLKIKVTAGGKSVGNLEVDLGKEAGAIDYYMVITDISGTAVIGRVPPGKYSIYFNNNNYPAQYGTPPVFPVEIKIGETTQSTIDLTSK